MGIGFAPKAGAIATEQFWSASIIARVPPGDHISYASYRFVLSLFLVAGAKIHIHCAFPVLCRMGLENQKGPPGVRETLFILAPQKMRAFFVANLMIAELRQSVVPRFASS